MHGTTTADFLILLLVPLRRQRDGAALWVNEIAGLAGVDDQILDKAQLVESLAGPVAIVLQLPLLILQRGEIDLIRLIRALAVTLLFFDRVLPRFRGRVGNV
ncbi:MAG: hypothetical protein RJQ08_03920 [Salinisphaeraceae bacterium]|uniref:hypothetical protein n=1 Tax=Algiphilus sp. TaxID=1872431 RepID=UPI0032ED9069